MMVLYSAAGTISLASHIALEEVALPYELKLLSFLNKEQTSEHYLKINPKARVPALLIGEQVLTETPAILTYLAQVAPESSLALPTDPLQAAHIHAFNAYLCSTVHIAHAHKMRGARWTDNEQAMKAMTEFVPKSMAACYQNIEDTLFKGPWVHGEQLSISDAYLFAITQWLGSDGVDVNQFPKVAAHHQAMQNRDSVKRALSAY